MTHRDINNSDVAPSEDIDLDEWYLCSQLFKRSHGSEIADAKLFNEVKGRRRNNNQHLFSSQPGLRDLVSTALCGPGCDCGSAMSMAPRIPAHFKKYKRLKFAGQTFGSSLWRRGSDSDMLCRWRTGSEEEDTSMLFPGNIQYFIEVDVVTSHPSSLQVQTQTHRYVVCKWYQSKTIADDLYGSTWMDCFTSGAAAEKEALIPISRLCTSFLKGPVSDNCFKIMLKPNLLILWHPDQENRTETIDESEGEEANDQDESGSDIED